MKILLFLVFNLFNLGVLISQLSVDEQRSKMLTLMNSKVGVAIEHDSSKCPNNFVLSVRQKHNLTLQELHKFLLISDTECKKNLEFMRIYNESLFTIWNKVPADIINALAVDGYYDKNLIIQEIQNPIRTDLELYDKSKVVSNIALMNIFKNAEIDLDFVFDHGSLPSAPKTSETVVNYIREVKEH